MPDNSMKWNSSVFFLLFLNMRQRLIPKLMDRVLTQDMGESKHFLSLNPQVKNYNCKIAMPIYT